MLNLRNNAVKSASKHSCVVYGKHTRIHTLFNTNKRVIVYTNTILYTCTNCPLTRPLYQISYNCVD